MRTFLVSSALILACGCSKQAPPSNTAESVGATVPAASADDPLSAALAAPTRKPESTPRDRYRHPRETLAFFGVRPGLNVIELWPGGGWYTEILAPLLREQGTLSAVVPTGKYLPPYKEFLASAPAVYDRVTLLEVTPPGPPLSFGSDGAADIVLTFRNVHGWVGGGYAKQVHEAAFKALKPGGVFGVVEHRAKPGSSAEESAKTGYVSEEAEIALATAAGFVLEEKSEINANPSDTKDYPNGVWSLPPSLKGGDVDKDKFLAIGESDRMTLRFKKPAQ